MRPLIGRVFGVLIFIALLQTPVMASYRDLFQRQFIDKPWAGAPIIEAGVCIDCHTSKLMSDDYLKIPQEWQMSIHRQYDVSCHNCHGGDPSDVAKGCESPHGGYFIGVPKPKQVPEMCGRCHIGIKKRYLESGHGKALMERGVGPTCVTCHGSHRIQKANIDIINSVRCSQCHTYERARAMKQALFSVEKRFKEIEDSINAIKKAGGITDDLEKRLFRTMAEYRTIFHTVNVQFVKEKTGEFNDKLQMIESDINGIISELNFRRDFSGYLLILFSVLFVVYHFYTRASEKKGTVKEGKEG